MTRRHSGEPAFPAIIPYEHSEAQGKDYPVFERSGMELRDYFAAHAPGVGDERMWQQGDSSVAIDAARAYRWADAMMEARKK